jgi:hypothetical protein
LTDGSWSLGFSSKLTERAWKWKYIHEIKWYHFKTSNHDNVKDYYTIHLLLNGHHQFLIALCWLSILPNIHDFSFFWLALGICGR